MPMRERAGWAARVSCCEALCWATAWTTIRCRFRGARSQGGARRGVFILRPPIVLADEPTGNLDSTNGAHVLELLLNLNRTEGTTLVLVTHDPVLAAYANRRIVLRDGLIIADEINPNPAAAPREDAFTEG